MSLRRRSAISSKWGSNFTPKPNMINSNIQHHQPFVLTPKVSEKLTPLYILLPLTHWQITIPILHPFSIAHITLRHKTQHLQNMHVKTYKHYLHHYFYKSSFRHVPSTSSSWSYASLVSLYNSPLSVYRVKRTVTYRSQYHLYQNKVNRTLVLITTQPLQWRLPARTTITMPHHLQPTGTISRLQGVIGIGGVGGVGAGSLNGAWMS